MKFKSQRNLLIAASLTLLCACTKEPEKKVAENVPAKETKTSTEAQPDKKTAMEKPKLTEMQCHVTKEDGTEPPFQNEYWDNKKPGIYVDLTSGEALFSSKDKYDSGTGWPSFMRPIKKEVVVEKTDRALGMARTEVRSTSSDSHLGHVFNDGPAPTGMRYCMNSAALRFIPVEKLQEEGYGQYLELFKDDKKP